MEDDMEIILVNPGGTPAGGDTYKVNKQERYMYPYSIVYVQNYLTKKGIKSKLFDLYIRSTDEFIKYCKKIASPIIGVTSQTYSSIIAIDLIRRIKKENPTAIIVVGGKHFTYSDKDAMEKISDIDIVVRGEGEITFYELVKALQDKRQLDAIDGITFRKNGRIISNKERDQIRNIEEVSLDYETLPDVDFYAKGIYLRNFEKEKIKSLPLFMGRGCSQKCVFCLYNKFMYRARKLDSILNELYYLKEKFNKSYFALSDPSFCERKGFATRFCTRLIKEQFNIKWSCEARVDTPYELLELMSKAGCVSLDFALESGSNKVLRTIKKRIDVARVLDFAKACKKLNIRAHVFLMVSLPEETEEDAYETLKMAKVLSQYCSSMSAAATQIFPGTELEQIAYEKGILPPNFSYNDSTFFHPYTDLCDKNVPLYIEKLTIEFIRKFMKEMSKIKNVEYDTLNDLLIKAAWGIRKIPQQSLSKNMNNVSRFFSGIWGKTQKQLSRFS
jgi:radical SAM superfamily enzyme YgiQ (UPF0313 family)